MNQRPALIPIALVAALALFAYVVFATAWISDDTFITLRTVDNFTSGHGLTWNTVERVQVYTHPLWMFLLSLVHVVTREPYFSTIILGLFVSTVAVACVTFKLARSAIGSLLAIGILTTSMAFVDYSTSGLENPLSHLLLAVFLMAYFRISDAKAADVQNNRLVFLVSLLAGLCVLNRMDCLLLVAPALLWLVICSPKPARILAIAAGFAPFIVWEVFSVIYYGFPFPNTAYAKLNTGIFRSLLFEQGFYYFRNSLVNDPVTLPVIFIGVAVPFVTRKRQLQPLALGLLLYLAYIMSVGGDFMSGRLFTVPFLIAVVLMSRLHLQSRRRWVPLAVVIVGLGLFAPNSRWRSGPEDGTNRDGLLDAHKIANERDYYFQRTGFHRTGGFPGMADDPEAITGRAARARGKHLVMGGNIGVFGYYAGPEVHILDGFALSDPLLARLPIRSTSWRVGHYVRRLPTGYFKSLESGRNIIEDSRLRHFATAIQTVTRGPLFSRERWAAIWRLNTGAYDVELASFFAAYRHSQLGARAIEHGEFETAIEELKTAVELDATLSEAWYDLSRLYLQAGRLTAAEPALYRAIKLRAGRYEDELDRLAAAYREVGHVKRAQAVTKTAHAAHMHLGNWYEEKGWVGRAIAEYEKALQLPVDHSEVRGRLEALRSTDQE